MSIFGKNHYIKFCVMMFSWQKMAESEYYGSVQDIIYVTGSGKKAILEQILVLSNGQIYGLQCIIS